VYLSFSVEHIDFTGLEFIYPFIILT